MSRKKYSKCSVCGKAILKKGSKHCKKCLNKILKSKRTIIRCPICGIEKDYAGWQMKSGRKYCSKKCFHIAGNKAFQWTEEEKNILRNSFADSSKDEIMELIPRKSYGSIYKLAETYGLKKSKIGFFKSLEQRSSGFKPWTDDELKILINQYSSSTLQEILNCCQIEVRVLYELKHIDWD